MGQAPLVARVCFTGDVVRGNVVLDARGKPIAPAGTAMDVALRRALAAARETRGAWSDTVLAWAPGAIAVASTYERSLRRRAIETTPRAPLPPCIEIKRQRTVSAPRAPRAPSGVATSVSPTPPKRARAGARRPRANVAPAEAELEPDMDVWAEVLEDDPAAYAQVFATNPPVLTPKIRRRFEAQFFAARGRAAEQLAVHLVNVSTALAEVDEDRRGHGRLSRRQLRVEESNQQAVYAAVKRLRRAEPFEHAWVVAAPTEARTPEARTPEDRPPRQ